MNDLVRVVSIYRTLRDRKQVDGNIEGYVDIEDDSMRSFLLQTEEGSRSEEIGIAILSEPEDVAIGSAIHIRLFLPKSLPIFRSLTGFLGNGSRLLGPIGEFYLIKEDWFSEDPEPLNVGANLDSLHHILLHLRDAATLVDGDKARLLFADNAGVVDIPINISLEDLKSLTPEEADEFVAFCSDHLHRKHRLEAVAKVVIRKTRGIPASERLHHVLREIDSILADARSEHAIFLSAFSYEKVRDEVEALKVEYTAKIHKVISEIQGQLLGIPAATVVVATQMKRADSMGTVFITNSAVLLGAFIFGVFLILLLKNQWQTLQVIEGEVKRQKDQLQSKLPEVAKGSNATFTMLEQRISHQRHILWTVGVVVVVGLLLSCIAFLALNSTVIKTAFQ